MLPLNFPRQVRLQTLAMKETISSTAKLNGYCLLKKFHFFEIRPIERKSNTLNGSFEEINMSWEISDVTFNEGDAFSAETFNTTMMVLKINRVIPVFTRKKKGF